jgi:tetratricopeptide (TPR) repeat protein
MQVPLRVVFAGALASLSLTAQQTNIDVISFAEERCSAELPELQSAYGLNRAHDYRGAQQQFEKALQVQQSRTSPNTTEQACIMNRIGSSLLDQVRAAEAVGWFEQALQKQPESARLKILILGNLATAYIVIGELKRAEKATLEAFQTAEQELGAADGETILALVPLGVVRFVRGDLAGAESIFRRVLLQLEKSEAKDQHNTAVVALNLGVVYAWQKRPGLARPVLIRALEAFKSSPRTRDDDIPLCLASLMLTYALERRREPAKTVMKEMLVIAERTLGTDHPSYGTIFEHAGIAHSLLQDYPAARESFERAIPLLENHYGRGSDQVATCLRHYLDAAKEAKDKSRLRRIEARLAIAQGLVSERR